MTTDPGGYHVPDRQRQQLCAGRHQRRRHVDIIATTDGTYRGIAFFQDRNAPVRSGSPNMLNGGSTMEIKGAIYFPKQQLSSAAATHEGSCTRIVAYTIEFTGNSGLNTDCGYGFEESQTWPPVLTE